MESGLIFDRDRKIVKILKSVSHEYFPIKAEIQVTYDRLKNCGMSSAINRHQIVHFQSISNNNSCVWFILIVDPVYIVKHII